MAWPALLLVEVAEHPSHSFITFRIQPGVVFAIRERVRINPAGEEEEARQPVSDNDDHDDRNDRDDRNGRDDRNDHDDRDGDRHGDRSRTDHDRGGHRTCWAAR